MASKAMALAMSAPSGRRVTYQGGGAKGREVNRRKPVEGDMSWQSQGTCRSVSPELFYPEESGGAGSAVTRDAKKVCKLCPVQRECLEFALKIQPVDDWGVWGGMTKKERAQLRLARNRKAA